MKTASRAAPPSEAADAVFRALADPTRRDLLDALRDGAKTTGQLAAMHPEMTRFGVMAHLQVLVDAGLILVRREGRERFNHLNAVPLQEIYERWVRPFAALPASELIALKGAVEKRKTT